MEALMVVLAKRTSIMMLVFVLMCSGCSRYEMKEDKEGRAVRIDHWTGEVTIFSGDRMIRVKSQEEQEAEDKKRAASLVALAKPKTLTPHTLRALGGGFAMLATSWRDGMMFYQFSVSPLSKRVEQARNSFSTSFNLMLYDDAGFKIKEIKVRVSSMTGNVDEAGKPQGLSMEDSELCSEDDYQHITNWNVSWYGFGPS
jgi:hypothetical protein